jgi:hypothetical protein
MSKQDWTTDRPTEPGEYWVSIEPGKRIHELADFAWPLRTNVTASLCGMNGLYFLLSEEVFDGAKWSRCETPADPFEEVAT